VKFDKKIEDLLSKGKISVEEAHVLKRSLRENVERAKEIRFHSQFSYKYMAVAVLGNVVLGTVWMILNAEPEAVRATAVATGGTIQNVSEIMNQTGKVGEMNKSLSTLISIVLISLPVLGSLFWFTISYNGLVNQEEDVLSSWAQVESNYQRRTDLIPNLVDTVRAYAEHENQTQTDVARLRAEAFALKAEAERVSELSKDAVTQLDNEKYMQQLAQDQQSLGGRIRGVMLTVEGYPALRASDQFLQLQAQLEGTENRINVARMAFNEKVGTFNAAIRRMPASLIAGMGNFQRKAYFKAEEGSDKAVKADFGRAPAQVAPVTDEIETPETPDTLEAPETPAVRGTAE
jgi:LemA protein